MNAALEVKQWVLPDMHCAHCVKSLENLPQHLEGVWRAEVNFPKKRIQVEFDPTLASPERIEAKFREMGFSPLVEKADSTAPMRRLIGQLAVAGFAFGNVMMMSLADYVGGNSFRTSGFEFGFKVWSMVLSVPVVLYSAAPFFRQAWAGLRTRQLNLDLPVAMGILTLAITSVSMEGLGYFDSLTGLVFFLLLGKWYQAQSHKRLMREHGLEDWLPLHVTAIEADGQAILRPIASLTTGQHIRIFHGEVVPADCTLTGPGEAVVDRAFLTGESLPQTVAAGAAVAAGTRNAGPAMELHVDKAVNQSDLMRLWNSEAFQKDLRSSLANPIDVVAKQFTWIVLMLATLGWLLWWPDTEKAMLVFASVLIVACPCALALSIPFAYGATARHMARMGFFLKHSDVMERFAHIRHIVFDKTGTLTTSERFQISWNSSDSKPTALAVAMGLAQHSAHPISRALVSWGAQRSVAPADVTGFSERPGQGIEAQFDGATWRLGSASFTGGTDPDGGPGTWVHLACDGTHQGSFFLTRPLRPGVGDQLHALQHAGYQLHLLSGDSDHESVRFANWFEPEHMHFRQTPQAKMEFIAALEGEGVAMVGDGLNDAGALRTATLGLAVADELYAFSPSADALVQAEKLALLPAALRMAQAGRRTVKLLLAVSVLYNIIGLSFALQGWLTPLVAAILMPVSSLTVVSLALARARRTYRKLTSVTNTPAGA